MRARFCTYCGAPLDETSGKCSFCGFFNQLNGAGENGTQQAQSQVPPQMQPHAQSQPQAQQEEPRSYVNLDYVDHTETVGGYSDPRWGGTVDPNMQYGTRQVPQVYGNAPYKSRVAAALLAFLFGAFGAHKFYLGEKSTGIVYFLMTFLSCGVVSFIPAVISVIEAIIYLTMSDEAFEDKFHVSTR